MNTNIIVIVLALLSYTVKSQQLNNYSWVVDRVNIEAYDNPKNTNYSKDDEGVIKSNDVYHPLTVCIYGILNYHHFLKTKDSTYYHRVIEQTNYFRNNKHTQSRFNNQGIGLPYPFKFHDLDSGWFSGMTQGAALSFILRYKDLTGNHDLDSVLHKIAYLLIQPVENGGCISNADNRIWIEEYPNSKEAVHVLNGAINGYIGLLEYSKTYPDKSIYSKLAKQVYDNIVYYLPQFNQKNWARYDLGHRMCDPGYMRLHIYQMKSLYELTGDDLFKRQQILWAAQLNGREQVDTTGRVKFLKTHISKMYEPGYGKWYLPKDIQKPQFSTSYSVDSILFPEPSVFKVVVSLKDTTSFDYALIHAQRKTDVSELRIEEVRNDSIFDVETSFHQMDSSTFHVRFTNSVKPRKNSRLNLYIEANYRPYKPLFSFLNKSHPDTTNFGHYYSNEIQLDSNETYQMFIPNIEVKYLKIFYKAHETLPGIEEQDFNPMVYVHHNKFKAPKTGFYKFLVCFEKENDLSSVGALRYQKIPKNEDEQRPDQSHR